MNGEPDEDYAFFFDTLAKWKPFMKTIVEASRGTFPAGLSDYDGVRERGFLCGDFEEALLVKGKNNA